MLVLARKRNETIKIGSDITLTVIEVRGSTVRLGIDAPRDIVILRGELEPHEPAPASVAEQPELYTEAYSSEAASAESTPASSS